MQKSDTEAIFENILRTVNLDPKKELEVRFHGRFLNTQTQNFKLNNEKVFKSSVQANVFYDLLSIFRKGDIKNVIECEPESYQVCVVNGRSERLITHQDGTQKYIKKTREFLPRPFEKNIVYVNPKGFKIGLATEEEVTDKGIISNLQKIFNDKNMKIMKRNINRTTFVQHIFDINEANPMNVFRFDFSIVRIDSQEEPQFEIELEYTGNKQHFIDDVATLLPKISKHFLENIEIMLKLIHTSSSSSKNNVITWTEHDKVLIAYNTLLLGTENKNDQVLLFRGAQPESLSLKKFDLITKKPYFVADKSDGERAHLLCSQDGSVYLISRFLHVIKMSIKCTTLNVSIFDVEWFQKQDKIIVFDVLVLNGNNIRQKITKERIEILKSIDWDTCGVTDSVNIVTDNMSNMSNNDTKQGHTKFIMKKMYYSPANSFPKKEISKVLNETEEYTTDGLIFTPADEPYPFNRKWENLLKWKPPNTNSIDLYIEKGLHPLNCSKGYYLYANSSQILHKQTGEHGILVKEVNDKVTILYDNGKEEILDKRNVEYLRNLPTKKIKFYPCEFLQEDQIFNSLMINEHVIEFIYNIDTKFLEPIRVRDDKSALGFRGSNFMRIALDTWDTMVNPILKEHLMRYNNQKKDKQKSLLSNSFMFHNVIKENMIRTCCEYVTRPFYREMKTLPSTFDPDKNAWILPAIDEIADTLKKKYSYITGIQQGVDEIIIPISTHKINDIKLLDMCTGKGGDIWKWIRSGIKYVFAVDDEHDLLVDSEDSAINRLQIIRDQEPDAKNTNVLFLESDAKNNLTEYLMNKQVFYEFDIASCFFAMHYFFGSQTEFDSFFSNVNNLLSYGGYFVGTIMNGEMLNSLLNKGGGIYRITDSGKNLCTIQQKYQNCDSLFGAEIEVDICDSILNDYLPTQEKKMIKKEYLVDLGKMQTLLHSYGYELVEFMSLFDVLNNVHPHNPSHYNITLSKAEMEFTSLFTCFTFQKRTNSLWKKKINIKTDSQPQSLQKYREGFEDIWKQKFQGLCKDQFKNSTCDSLEKKPQKIIDGDPLFNYIESKTKVPQISEPKNNDIQKRQRDFPVFTLKIKRTKTDDFENQNTKPNIISENEKSICDNTTIGNLAICEISGNVPINLHTTPTPTTPITPTTPTTTVTTISPTPPPAVVPTKMLESPLVNETDITPTAVPDVCETSVINVFAEIDNTISNVTVCEELNNANQVTQTLKPTQTQKATQKLKPTQTPKVTKIIRKKGTKATVGNVNDILNKYM